MLEDQADDGVTVVFARRERMLRVRRGPSIPIGQPVLVRRSGMQGWLRLRALPAMVWWGQGPIRRPTRERREIRERDPPTRSTGRGEGEKGAFVCCLELE